ncbi:uncharacterized protein LOC141613913 [Silene latifolia]|uniref:uncharacterized protein LOC141613913 n=1 Tax=Silene latifolia TaxID=37657 RepID=UPI003D774056
MCRLFYDILRKSQTFEWTQEHEKAFREIKQYLSTPPLLSKPEQGEPMYLYLSATKAAVSAVLRPVVINYPLRTIMRKPKLSGRMVKWSVHLSGYDLKFEPRTAIKSQAIADFVSDFSHTLQEQADSEILTLSEAKGEQIEEEAFPQILEKHVISFIKRNMIEDYYARWNIKLFKSNPRNPQSNGQAESSNKMVMNNLKRRLEEIGANWADELPFVLWSDRTTPKVALGQTPFSLVYGAEAVIPSEVQVPTHRYVTEERNQVEMASSLDTNDEPRTSAQIRMAAYKQTTARSYNKNVRLRTLQVGDLVLRKVFPNTMNQSAGKFAYNWEGPYRIEGIVGNGAYKLETMDGEGVPRSWNIIHLKKYYV